MGILFFIFTMKRLINYNLFEKNNLEHEQKYDELLKAICLINYRYLAIGKINGELSIYDLNNKKEVYSQKIFSRSITNLIKFGTENESKIISCSEDSTIKILDLFFDNDEYNLKEINIIPSKHKSSIKKLEHLGNNKFASCSKDSTFIIWNLNKDLNEIELKDIVGIENFFIKVKKKIIQKIVLLNEKGCLSFYENEKGKFFLKYIIPNIDYTNSNSMIKYGNKILIGGYKSLQIISFETKQIETLIKIGSPISYIYSFNDHNNLLFLGLKTGELKIINNKCRIINNNNQKEMKSTIFDFSKLYNEKNEVKLFDNLPIISFLIGLGKIFCISDEIFKVYNLEKMKTSGEYKVLKSINFL